ncbi:MAG: hypothetical protein M3N98_12925 [Actinomycetota bacterium]|nr:hypothetical protein [Actinomycetota bacterium]
MRAVRLGVVAVMVAAGCLSVGPAAAAGGPYCGQVWGSTAKQAPGGGISISGVRAGAESCYDRLVIDVNGPGAGYSIQYVSQVLTQGQGTPLSLRGGAAISVTVYGQTYDARTGRPTYKPSDPASVVNVSGFRTFRQVAYGGSFEGETTFGVGVLARLPFRVFVLAGPGSSSRVVVDVGHQW